MNRIKKPEQLTQWKWNAEEMRLENPKFGKIQMVSVIDEDGQEKYQQPIWSEKMGSIIIVINDKREIAFVLSERHAVLPTPGYQKTWDEDGIPNILELKTGIRMLEIPRGFSPGMILEAREEASVQINDCHIIRRSCCNTTFFATAPYVIAAIGEPLPEQSPNPDPNERIIKVVWIKAERVFEQLHTICAQTTAALFWFQQWAFKDKKQPFLSIAQAMVSPLLERK